MDLKNTMPKSVEMAAMLVKLATGCYPDWGHQVESDEDSDDLEPLSDAVVKCRIFLKWQAVQIGVSPKS